MIEYNVSDGVCILRLNAPPVNAVTFALLDALGASIRRANADDDVRGIVIVGDDSHFSAGADVNLFKEIAKREDAIRMSLVFQEAFATVEDSDKPVAAALAGNVMGCALELAMACHWRVCERKASFCMPESTFGINPGAGGTQRLPRLVGLDAALRILLTAEPIDAARAAELGLVDAVCEAPELLETARALLQSPERPFKTSLRTDKVRDAAANEAAFKDASKRLAQGRREIIAPAKILEAVEVGLTESFEAGLLAEQEGFAQCMDTLATRNKLHVYFAIRQAAKVPALEDVKPAKIAHTAVIGMGSMGTGIAQALIGAGLPVVVRDEDVSALEKGRSRIRKSVEKRVARGKLAPERAEAMLGLLSATTDWKDIARAGLVIEAVFEDVAVKRSVLAEIEAVCRAETIIASNTSTISLDVLAEDMRYPERLIGMHFFNPAHRMPLVEVIHRDATPAGVIATALAVAKRLRKTPVLVRNREGFLVNRLFIPYLKEAFYLLEDGAEAGAIDAAMVEFGFPMGPLALIDMAGVDILVSTDAVLRNAFPVHGPLSAIAARLVERGHVGQKSLSGVYKYEEGDYTPHRNEAAENIIAAVRRDLERDPREIGAAEIMERLVLRMVNEALHVMEERIAQRESDIDAATVLGIGFPDFRGGVVKYACDLGVAEWLDTVTEEYGPGIGFLDFRAIAMMDRGDDVMGVVAARLEALARRFGDRFKPPESLRKTKGS